MSSNLLLPTWQGVSQSGFTLGLDKVQVKAVELVPDLHGYEPDILVILAAACIYWLCMHVSMYCKSESLLHCTQWSEASC
jgi:hypothetical protein